MRRLGADITVTAESKPRLAVDIGGTFTDLVLRSSDGTVTTAKVPTTPANITEGILEGVAKVGAVPSALEAFVHGTTIALNALLERKTPSVGLITTAGFRDVLEIMRTNRPDMYDHQQEKPIPLVARRWRHEISARMTYTGDTVVDVDSDEVRSIASDFESGGISTIAVCLLHAYANPAHEKAVERLLVDLMPHSVISLSSDVSRVWREFERTSTTVSNAATKPIVSEYLEDLETSLGAHNFGGEVLIMQSNGGVMAAAEARRRPVATLMSGPVGGVTGATDVARRRMESANLVTLDIGGTSADVAIIDRAEAVSRTVGHIGPWPIMVPMVDIESIGAGGGSIAKVDPFGGLSVGPESAGAVPGPACVGQGGREATVTDANLVLGRLNPAYYLAGDLSLDVEAARHAIEENVARPFNMTCEEAALGIITVINSNMTRLLWEVMISRGYDPREFALLAFGGAGPLHACELAHALGIRDVLIPAGPGAFSAFGILMADARHDFERMLVRAGKELTEEELRAAFSELETQARSAIERERVDYANVDFIRIVELRYVGQDHPLAVDLPASDSEGGTMLSVARRLFHEKHQRLYGFRRDNTPVEPVRIQLSAVGRNERSHVSVAHAGTPGRTKPKTHRSLFFGNAFHDVAIYERENLDPGFAVSGPCVVEESTSTTYVPPGSGLKVSEDGILHLAIQGTAESA